ncbi:hypothetical protein [Catellatospora sichuanensis]|uniref:hypothetical protein n=1 Tax=Catellatospora sichuanensis TaxID=1969805 RepID=UPI0011821E04|nr:hypothetical protein [Catellatospora sichuanensis]
MTEPLAEPQVRVVLDVTALTAYARLTGMAVPELLAMVEEESATSMVGVPAAHFMTTHQQLDEDERERLIDLLTRADSVVVLLPLLGAEAIEAAQMGHVMGHAVILARRSGAYLATYDGAEARRHLPGGGVLDLTDK